MKQGLVSSMKIMGHNHRGDREINDFYATPPDATERLLRVEDFDGSIYEPCCGMGHISKVFEQNGFNVESTDLIDRGFGRPYVDFLQETEQRDNIVTNPPYGNLLIKFMYHSQKIARKKTCFLLKLQALEGLARKEFYDLYPPVRVHVFSGRVTLMKNGDEDYKKKSSMMALAWYVWEKGNTKKPTINWL